MQQAELKFRQSVVLLGASNLTIGWRNVVHALHGGLQNPLDIYVALGMGRSYVDWSRFAGRELPGIVRCQLFDDLASSLTAAQSVTPVQSAGAAESMILPTSEDLRSFGPAFPAPLVLMTDIGNDLVYGRTPDIIAESLTGCIDRVRGLAPHSRILLTGLPLNSVMQLTRLRFLVTRSLLFPGCRLPLSVLLRRAEELDALVRTIAVQSSAEFVEPLHHWYGIDPIHIRRPLRKDAFHYLFSHWPEFCLNEVRSGVNLTFPSLPVVAEKRSFGRRKACSQPCFVTDQMTIFGY